jgi:small subunit ribosomal protein S16
MATVIRMKRGGRTHAPHYRIVVVDSRDKATGRVIEEIGTYDPCGQPEPSAEVDTKRALTWLHTGATVSDTVRSVLSKKGIMAAFAAGTKPEDIEEPAAEAAPQPEAEAAPAPEPVPESAPVPEPEPAPAAVEETPAETPPEPETTDAE